MREIIPTKYIDTIEINKLSIQNLEELSFCKYTLLSTYLIGKIPAEKILDTNELDIYHNERTKKIQAKAIKAKKLVIVLKATRLCNLRCTYCHSWAEGPNQTISFSNAYTHSPPNPCHSQCKQVRIYLAWWRSYALKTRFL